MDWWFWLALGALLGWWAAPCVDAVIRAVRGRHV